MSNNKNDVVESPKDYVERRKIERRVLCVDSSYLLVKLLMSFILVLIIGAGVAGALIYDRIGNLDRELLVEDVSVPPIDIAIDQPIDPIEVEEPSIEINTRRRR